MADAPGWYTEGLKHIWLPYTQMKRAPLPLPVVASEGVRLTLADGRLLIDGVASWWTAVHGYNDPHIRAAVSRRLARLPHVMLGGLVHEEALALAARLAALLPGDLSRVFFSESGSVSVEIALKIALQYWLNQGVKGRTRFVSFKGGYHGDTFAAMSVCDPEEGMHALFSGALAEQHVVSLPQTDAALERFSAFLRARADEIAAVIMEPVIQGAGGMRVHAPHVVSHIARACRDANVLLVLDEIFTGFGRTGTLFACEQAGVMPDIITLSKALTGGTLPLAATVAREPVFARFWSDDPMAALMHGPTYSGNALACAAANASLDLFAQQPRLAQVASIESQLKAALAPAQKLPGVREVRVKGAMGAIELDQAPDHAWLTERFVERGLWLRPFGRIVYTTPPYVIEKDDLSRITSGMLEVTEDWLRGHASQP